MRHALLGHVRWLAAGLMLLATSSVACAPAGKPNWATRLQPAPPGVSLDPRPDRKLVWLHADSARIPATGPAGEPWDDDNSGPDPVLFVVADEKEILKFPTVADTLTPSWKRVPGGNVSLDKIRALRLELRDADGLNSKLIGIATLTPESMRGSSEARTIELQPAGRVEFRVEPAHALVGLGLDYRMYRGDLIVTETLSHGPADRVGIRPGDKLVQLDGKAVSDMSPAEVKSVLNGMPVAGIDVVVLHNKSNTSETVKLREGPIYALLQEYGPLP